MRVEASVDYGRFVRRKPVYCAAAVLVVDDEAIAVTVVTQLLKRIGFEDIDPAPNGVVARAMMEEKKYGLVISDWNMPEMNGLELLRALRADERFKQTPFMMTSIDGSLERVKIARLTGVSAFLLKPFDEMKLRSKLDEVFLQPSRRAVTEGRRPVQSDQDEQV
jgi:two-component system chemotaxis response regulator CheY